ncbi:MAG: PilZ domain-containing protein [Deltaproteobacteria bacterium]|nr:PilZ domain-containing protein [Deltaproteobacteria bacterium]
MKQICNWCQKEFEHDRVLLTHSNPKAYYICANCLVPFVMDIRDDEDLEMLPSNESRIAPRFPIYSELTISSEKDGKKIDSAIILNISDSGMKLETRLGFEYEEKILLTINGDNVTFQNRGEVVYCQQINTEEPAAYQLGINFEEKFKK